MPDDASLIVQLSREIEHLTTERTKKAKRRRVVMLRHAERLRKAAGPAGSHSARSVYEQIAALTGTSRQHVGDELTKARRERQENDR